MASENMTCPISLNIKPSGPLLRKEMPSEEPKYNCKLPSDYV